MSERSGPLRLREIWPIKDRYEHRTLLYDLERTFVIDVPERFREEARGLHEAGSFSAGFQTWLTGEGLLTAQEPVCFRDDPDAPLPALTDVSIDLSGACNMACVYCFENEINSRIGPAKPETLKRAVDFAFEHTSKSRRLALHFGSGEPLMHFSSLQQVVRQAEMRAAGSGHQLSFELTTNASLVTPEIADFLARHAFSVRVSCDGPKEIHNRFRPLKRGGDSYDAVAAGLGRLLERMPDHTTVNTVIARGTRLSQLWSWAKALGIKHFHTIKVGAYEDSELSPGQEELAEYCEDLRTICDELFESIENSETPIDFQPILKIVRRLMIPMPITRFCGVAGTYLGIATDGKVYPCFRHLGMEQYHLGDIASDLDNHLRRSFLNRESLDVDRRPKCNTCRARYLCGGGCYADSTVYASNPAKPQHQHCPFWQAEAQQAILFYQRLLNTDPMHCVRLFGDKPEELLQSIESSSGFLRSTNCG